MEVKAVIFDLDGVIVATDEYHYSAWKKMSLEEGVPFDREINERLRGVSRAGSLEIILERAEKTYTPGEKAVLAGRKNEYYREMLKNVSAADILPGVMEFMEALKNSGVKIAVASSSRNCAEILERIKLSDYFDAVVDGNCVRRAKPHPEIFLLAAELMGVQPGECLVIEDAEAGVSAAIAGGMRVAGVGCASRDERAGFRAENLRRVKPEDVLAPERGAGG